MAVSEFEIFKVEKAAKEFCSERNKNYPPDQLYIDFKFEDQALFLIEVRPKWNDPAVKTEMMFAKLRYIKKEKQWKLYWQRQNKTWLLYEPDGINQHLEPLLQLVWNDKHGFFWG
ncbi:MAG: DUF3024 domain-containing protein [Gammaproteobacteria bacterium]